MVESSSFDDWIKIVEMAVIEFSWIIVSFIMREQKHDQESIFTFTPAGTCSYLLELGTKKFQIYSRDFWKSFTNCELELSFPEKPV